MGENRLTTYKISEAARELGISIEWLDPYTPVIDRLALEEDGTAIRKDWVSARNAEFKRVILQEARLRRREEIRVSAEASAGAAKSRSMGDLPQWVCWRAELREGKATKVPYSPHSGSRARSDDLATFGTLSEAKRAAREGDYDGIGFVFTESDSFCGVDLDGGRPAGLRAGARHRQGSALTQAAIREACRRSTSLR